MVKTYGRTNWFRTVPIYCQPYNKKVWITASYAHHYNDNRTKSITGIRFEGSNYKAGFPAGLRHAEKRQEENNKPIYRWRQHREDFL